MIQSKLFLIFVCIQREVIPILEDTFSKYFPKKMNLSDTKTLDSYDGEALERLTDYYFNNEDPGNLKVVFLVHQEEAAEMKALRQELEQKLGEKVVFKNALFNVLLREVSHPLQVAR